MIMNNITSLFAAGQANRQTDPTGARHHLTLKGTAGEENKINPQ
jgi:hypothetical protein